MRRRRSEPVCRNGGGTVKGRRSTRTRPSLAAPPGAREGVARTVRICEAGAVTDRAETMSDTERRTRWNERWTRRDYADIEPAQVVRDYAYLLPPGGEVLELACGLGVNALALAAAGFRVTAWDYAESAIARLREEAAQRDLVLRAEVRDVVAEPPPPASFDGIVVTRFLERDLCPALAAALRPGGVLCYQSFVRDAVSDRGPQDTAFRFAPNELLELFPGLRVLAFHDEGRTGDTARGLRDESLLVAQRVA